MLIDLWYAGIVFAFTASFSSKLPIFNHLQSTKNYEATENNVKESKINGHESSVKDNIQAAIDLRTSGNPFSAVQILETVVTEENIEAHFQLGMAYTDMGLAEEAIESFNTVNKLDKGRRKYMQDGEKRHPSIADIALANLLLDSRGQKKRSYSVFKMACANGYSSSRPSPVSFLSAVTADSLGLHPKARIFYKDALQYNPLDYFSAVGLLSNYLRFGNDDNDNPDVKKLEELLPVDMLSSLDYVAKTDIWKNPSVHYFTHDMLHLGMKHAKLAEEGGLILEFGVFFGKTIRMAANYFPNFTVHGFDTFDGLPEDWRGTKAQSYSTHGALPPAPSNVKYHVGLFSETLPKFLNELEAEEEQKEQSETPVAFVNIDCDLYSSTVDALEPIANRIVPGTVIVFDEYVMNPRWQDDEYKAFQQAVNRYKWNYEYLGISLVTGQAVIQII